MACEKDSLPDDNSKALRGFTHYPKSRTDRHSPGRDELRQFFIFTFLLCSFLPLSTRFHTEGGGRLLCGVASGTWRRPAVACHVRLRPWWRDTLRKGSWEALSILRSY
jgi:hypothetical protein